MTEVHQFKSALDTFEYTNGVYNHTIAPGIWTYIDVDELNFEHLVDIVSKTHGIKIYVANQENFFKKFEIEIGANLGSIGSIVSVEDSLASTSTTNALSANQGKLLNDAIGLKLDASSYNDYYKGTYTTLGNLQAATPTSTAGSYAIVDTGVGNDAKLYIWDAQDGWVSGGTTTASTTDTVTEGSTNLYFTNGRAVSALTASLLSNLTPTVNTQPGLSYTVGTVGTDNNGKTILRMDNGAANTATITTAQTMPISVRQAGLGTTTIAAGAGVTLNGALVFTAQHQTKTIYRVSSGIYDVVG